MANHDLAHRLHQRAFLLEMVSVTLEHHMRRPDAVGERGIVYGRGVEGRGEVAPCRLPRDEAHERLARVKHAIAPAAIDCRRAGMHFTRPEGDDRPDVVHAPSAPVNNVRGAPASIMPNTNSSWACGAKRCRA